MTHKEIREKFRKYFESKGHVEVPSSSLVPEGDSSVLFTTAGMQQFKSFYTGTPSPKGDKVFSIQKCLRTNDIEEVGDETHLTFFEMLGNFAFNSAVSKREAIEYAYEFITKEMGLSIDYITIFGGDEITPRDTESEEIWKDIDASLDVREEGREDVFWGPTGSEGPCGPTTEVYVDGVEIWNIVFNEYFCDAEKNYTKLENFGIDTGMGLERLLVQAQGKKHIFETDLFEDFLKTLPEGDEKSRRVIADHVRSSVFMISDGVEPSNSDRGYILRRLVRSALRHSKKLGLEGIIPFAEFVIDAYGDLYTFKKEEIISVLEKESDKFLKTLEKGLKEFEKGERDAFTLFTTYGFPVEMTADLASEAGEEVDLGLFEEKMKDHQEKSKAGAEKKFKGGLAGTSDVEVKYHTATHLLHQALRQVLGNHVTQKGSNITPDRLRFDFSHGEKMTDDEKSRVEQLVNDSIQDSLTVSFEEVSIDEARNRGALGVFDDKYEDTVKIYQIGKGEDQFSLEICGGPHVENTSELGHFKIKKEEANSAGVRRIKAILE